MFRNVFLVTILLFNLLFVPVHVGTASAEWSPVHGGDAIYDLLALWGSSATDVYAVGTGGVNFHYDGNPGGDWETLPSISP